MVILVLIGWSVRHGSAVGIAGGVVAIVLFVLVARRIEGKLGPEGPALIRAGDVLTGGELRRPLPVPTTTFAVESRGAGRCVIVLRTPEETVRLTTDGWMTDEAWFVTKPAAERMLIGMGLTRSA